MRYSGCVVGALRRWETRGEGGWKERERERDGDGEKEREETEREKEKEKERGKKGKKVLNFHSHTCQRLCFFFFLSPLPRDMWVGRSPFPLTDKISQSVYYICNIKPFDFLPLSLTLDFFFFFWFSIKNMCIQTGLTDIYLNLKAICLKFEITKYLFGDHFLCFIIGQRERERSGADTEDRDRQT